MHKICLNLIDRFWNPKPKCVIQIMHLVSLNNIESLIEPQERERSVVIFSGLLDSPKKTHFLCWAESGWIEMKFREIGVTRSPFHEPHSCGKPISCKSDLLRRYFHHSLLFPCNFRPWKTFVLFAPTFKNDCCKIKLNSNLKLLRCFWIETVRKILLRKQTRYKTRMTCWT